MKKTPGIYGLLLLVITAPGLTPPASADIITFSGQIDIIFEDDGSGVFAGSPTGSAVNGFIDDQTFNGEVTVAGTTATFGCCIAAGGLDVTDNLVLDAETVALLNSLPGAPGFTVGQVVDGVDIEGDVLIGGSHRLEAGVSYILRPEAFASGDAGEYPFAPGDVLLALFFVLEEDGDNDVYDIVGVFASDLDNDGVADAEDNCQLAENPSQLDSNGDGYGNLCDPDLNNDGQVNLLDVGEFGDAFNSLGGDADFNGDGFVNFLDFSIAYPAYFLQPPGPSGLVP